MIGFYQTSTSKRRPTSGWYSAIDWINILGRQKNRCLDCSVKFTKKIPATVGRLRPVILGGTNNPSNIIAQCGSCNSSQGSKLHPSVA